MKHSISTKKDEMRINVYFNTLDVMISSISERFKQDTLELIKNVGSMLKLETNNEDTKIIASAFN